MSVKSNYALEVNDHLEALLRSFNSVKGKYIRRRANSVSIDADTERDLQLILYQMQLCLNDLYPMKDEDLPDIKDVDPNFESYRAYLDFLNKIVSDEIQEVHRALTFLKSYLGC